jgi:hypothetical protein
MLEYHQSSPPSEHQIMFSMLILNFTLQKRAVGYLTTLSVAVPLPSNGKMVGETQIRKDFVGSDRNLTEVLSYHLTEDAYRRLSENARCPCQEPPDTHCKSRALPLDQSARSAAESSQCFITSGRAGVAQSL